MTGAAPSTPPPIRVAILGAGPGGLAAAWGLTRRLPNGSRPNVVVTVYERSWRAGGKCASTRLPPSHRIVQNGTHYLFGVYFNAIQMIEEAHAELQDARFGGVGDFVPRRLMALKHYYGASWNNWKFTLPDKGQAFQNPASGSFSAPEKYLTGVLQALKQRLIDDGILPAQPALGQLLDLLIQSAAILASNPANAPTIAAIKNTIVFARAGVLAVMGLSTDLKVIQARILVDFVLTLTYGILQDELLKGPISKVDGQDFAAWLAHHGARMETCDSPLVNAWYDSVAAFENGNPALPRLSTAAVLQTVIPALVAYRGSFAFQMKAEVGESFIAPVYQALRLRGVKFRFLHELREIVPDSAGTRIERLIFRVPSLPGQPPGSAEVELQKYDPLAEFTLPGGAKRVYWPPEPKAPFAFVGRIEIDRPLPLRPFGPPRDEVKHEFGTDFDRVIFAIPHSAIPRVAPQLAAQKQAWQDLVDHLPSVETKSVRLWLRTKFEDLKWDAVDPKTHPVLSAYDPHFSTWEDGGQQLELHTWPSDPPQSIATVFGPLAAAKHPPKTQFCEWLHAVIQRCRARSQARAFLRSHVPGLWAGVVDATGAFKWSEVVPTESPPDGFREQWVVANCGACERYTHAAPGTFQYRLKSGDTGYANLSVAGEWTRFWPATANIELTVISGLRAAYDILGLNVVIPSEKGFFPS